MLLFGVFVGGIIIFFGLAFSTAMKRERPGQNPGDPPRPGPAASPPSPCLSAPSRSPSAY